MPDWTDKERDGKGMERQIPLSAPNFIGNEKEYALDAIGQGWVSTGGAYVKKMEGQLAGFLKAEDVAVCQSGTSALHLSLIEAGVQPGDVVIVPTFTFIAAVNPVRYQGAQPVFIDCDGSLCMDSVKLARFCREECGFRDGRLYFGAGQVKAVIVVHVFGNMADMEGIMHTAKKYGLKVIEDATEALGSYCMQGEYAGKYAGTIGDFGAYSFNGNKIITTGGGGAVTARNPQAVRHMRHLSTQAKESPDRYVHNEVGYNYRMTNVQAAVGVAQMEELPGFIKRKQENYARYSHLFGDFPLARLMPFREGVFTNKWLYSLEVDTAKVHATIQQITEKLGKAGIQVRAAWGLIHEQEPYKDAYAYQVEQAVHYASRILNIPSGTQLTQEDIAYVAGELMRLLEEMANGQ